MTWPWTSERCQFLILFQPLFLPPPSLFTQTIWLWTATYKWMRETATMPKNCPVVTSGDFGFCFLRFSRIVAIISWRDTIPSTSWDINMWEAGEVKIYIRLTNGVVCTCWFCVGQESSQEEDWRKKFSSANHTCDLTIRNDSSRYCGPSIMIYI